MTLISQIPVRTEVGWTSYSGLTLHRACPQKWSYKHLFRLGQPEIDDPAPPLRFGTWWHALRAADAIERGRQIGSLKHYPETLGLADFGGEDGGPLELPTDQEDLRARVLKMADQWNDDLPENHVVKWVDKFGTADVARMLKNLDLRYRLHYADHIKNQQPIAVESKWTRDLPGSDTTLLGYTDEIQYDAARDLVVVVDHKTAGRLDIMTTADDLLNSQLDLNAWGQKDNCEEWGVPQPQAIAFDRVLSKPPTRPKLTKSGSLSATVKLFDLPTYRAFCNSQEAKDAGYQPEQSQIDRISSPSFMSQWFQRPVRPVNRNLARAHLQAAVDTDHDAKATILRVSKRREAPRNFTGAACDWCSYAKLCSAQMIGGPDGEYTVEEYGLEYRGKSLLPLEGEVDEQLAEALG